ncbi:uncharacterized protein LOC112041911 [Lingula anatina]|uniref:Uncharacterized protein LOC112041911 n=1 Tax=Lingula anatina TaxID=7574 RepID=A0A2R2MMI4_LINAN|nr:uncharacterized protein LOC112041911 [Lingula anatina]|eukprot:XP_023931426.1 uncharacterized protein LOC112041911 [Lingula anatina]
MSRAVRGFVAFLAWTLFSFYAHYFARKALRTWGNIPQEQQETTEKKKALWYAVVILSLCQIVVGACVLLLLPRLCSRRLLTWMGLDAKESMSADPHSDTGVEKVTNGVTQGQEEPCESSRLPNTDLSLVTLSVSHMAATMCTNASLAFCDASSAFTVKAFEPITTAVLSSILSGKKLETNTIIALPLVVIGSIGFVWRPQYRMGETLGLTLAFLSNILFGLRNVTLKSMANKTPLVQVQTLAKMSTWAAFLLLFMEIFLAVAAPDMFPTLLAAGLLQPCLVSAILHVTYTVISTCIILKYISVVAHSMANLMKRISLALLFYIIGKHLLLPVNYFSGTVILLGLALYVFPAATKQSKYCLSS